MPTYITKTINDLPLTVTEHPVVFSKFTYIVKMQFSDETGVVYLCTRKVDLCHVPIDMEHVYANIVDLATLFQAYP